MNVKSDFSDLQRAECRAMIDAHNASDATAYKASSAEALRLLDAQVAAQGAPAPAVQSGPVRPGYAAGIAAYTAASTPDVRKILNETSKIEVTA